MKDSITKDSTGFSQIDNTLLNSVDISLKAKGLYSYMYSKPDNWNFTIRSMSKQLKEGITAIQSTLSELKKFGYVSYIKKKDGSGVYHLHIKPNPQNPNQGFTNLRKPTRINNTDLNNNKDNYKEKEIKEKDLEPSPSLKEKRKKEKDNITPTVNQITEELIALAKKYPKHSTLVKNFISKISDRYKPKTTKQKLHWLKSAILITENDDITVERLYEILKWGLEDEFWKRQINSIPALRIKNKADIRKIWSLDEAAPQQQKRVTNFS
jgi:hypothetical protein